MAEAIFLHMKPSESLYQKCLNCYVARLDYKVATLDSIQDLRYLPQCILVDIFVKMSEKEHLKDMLLEQLSDLDIFERLLTFSPARQKLFNCITALANSRKPLAAQLEQNFIARFQSRGLQYVNMDEMDEYADADENIWRIINFALRLGTFLAEAGSLTESINVLSCVAGRLKYTGQDHPALLVRLDCLQRLLYSEATLCNFKTAKCTYNEIMDIIENVPSENIPKSLLASTCTQLSLLFSARSEYSSSYKWSVVAMRNLTDGTPPRIAIDVLRQAAKACVVKRKFQRANMLICQAMQRAERSPVYGSRHQKYADTLVDYGFFLLNVDMIHQSVEVYENALDIKRFIFGSRNFHVAIVHEDLSYACYVNEYSSGDFLSAREHVEKAVDIMKDLIPNNHLILASARRVKALLLEEIALDKRMDGLDEGGLLQQSEDLHKDALHLSLEALGEMNVQTGKHYGNLGRLYQTMNRFEEAEKMHQKAIKIKTQLLGAYDYEVGLSIGHLASLYNYQMRKYREAEELYLRSIEISLRLFGSSYSGLEYDYLGLCHIYEDMREFEKYIKYATILENWHTLRGENNRNKATYPQICDVSSLEEVRNRFLEMDSEDQ